MTLPALPGIVRASDLDLHRGRPAVPVVDELRRFLPGGGLRRGSTVGVQGTALLLRLLAAATAAGSWAALIGLPDLGYVAATELGVDLDRVAVIDHPDDQAVAVAAACMDGMDLVVLAPGPHAVVTPAMARRLTRRVRERGAVLIAAGSWPTSVDIELRCRTAHWDGIGHGHGYLRSRRVTVTAQGRGAAAKPLHADLTLP